MGVGGVGAEYRDTDQRGGSALGWMPLGSRWPMLATDINLNRAHACVHRLCSAAWRYAHTRPKILRPHCEGPFYSWRQGGYFLLVLAPRVRTKLDHDFSTGCSEEFPSSHTVYSFFQCLGELGVLASAGALLMGRRVHERTDCFVSSNAILHHA